ncbi:phospholipid-transporting ATPase ABCA3-like [Saccostrea cucullata]|uniref:phospholipid-transporting ATPase ABCA3-like n=1 Tax=Saccostrea cuccullata TaxID=36930 RepID=UPI002ED2AA86
MVAGLFSQFLLLSWKNILLQRRKICVTVFEIILPLAFPVLLIVIRNLADYDFKIKEATTYEKESLATGYHSILYVPNTTLIESILSNSRQIIKESRSYGDLDLKGMDF